MTAAVITGASAGLGAEFTRQLVREFPDIEEFWLIARRVGKLEDHRVSVRQYMPVDYYIHILTYRTVNRIYKRIFYRRIAYISTLIGIHCTSEQVCTVIGSCFNSIFGRKITKPLQTV